MFKKIMTLTILNLFISAQALALNTPQIAFKDLKMSLVSADTMEVVYKNETVKIKRIDNFRLKLNDQNVILDASDDMEKAQQKMERAYKASNKRSATLDELFIPKAHAAPPMLFSMLFGGLLGFGLGRGSCDNNNSNQPAANEPSYVTPETAQ